MSRDTTDAPAPNDVEPTPLASFPPASLTEKPASVMRKFLESGDDFIWPDDVGQCSGSYCVLNGTQIPLEWERRISDTKAASIDVYRGGPKYTFKEAFVVKTIRGSDDISSRTKAAKEVENMKDLRHPHVAALLGTFLHSSRLSILIYPAARCDLHHFLKNISKELKNSHENLSDGSGSPDSTNSAHSLSSTVAGSGGEVPSRNGDEDYPLNLALPKSTDHLRRYFVCLSQALRYIHESDVRHKDIKPANVLIDSSGSVILTDFGISRRFAKSTSHMTNDRWEWTRKYASPEIMKGKKVPRDDPSDVFSLGCVFLEMITLILGKDHDQFRAFYRGNGGDAYFCNLENVHRWIGVLEELKQPADTSTFDASLINENIESHDFMPDRDQGIMDSLATIRQMLNENPPKRPISNELWKGFQSLSPSICGDCDERNETRWKPKKIRQHQNTESMISARRSQHKIHSSELTSNQSSRLSPERMTGEHRSRQQRTSLSAINPQISSILIHENVITHPDSIKSGRASPNRPLSSRSVRSDLNHPGSPQISGVSGPGVTEEKERYLETQNFTPNALCLESTNNQQIKNPITGKTLQNRTLSEEKLLPSTEIIVYDMEDKLPYVTMFCSLKGAQKPSPTLFSLTMPQESSKIKITSHIQFLNLADI